MKWRVTNALSRDVEREHLNRILAEIESYVRTTERPPSPTMEEVRQLVERLLGTPSFSPFTLSLSGAVVGSATITGGDVTVNTVAAGSGGLEDDPGDGYPYWRISNQWQQVLPEVYKLGEAGGEGFIARISPYSDYASRYIIGVEGEVVVENGSGVEGDPLLGLADVPDAGGGVLQKTEFDSKGRKVGSSEATTDDLPEGLDNLYFTADRAVEAVEDAGGVFISVNPVDGDILEYSDMVQEFVPTLHPRKISIDGGNF